MELVNQIELESLAEVLPSLQLLESLVLRGCIFHNVESQKQVFVALRSLKCLKELKLDCDINKDSVETLAELLLSLQLLEKLQLRRLNLSNNCDQRLFTAVQSLSYLKELDLLFTEVSPAGARNLTAVLPSLRNLTKIVLPRIEHDKNGEMRKILAEEASRIPRLKVYPILTVRQ